MKRTKKNQTISQQVKSKATTKRVENSTQNKEVLISTGSTLLDLAISGGRQRGGGLPAGILVEVFGPPGSGKTVLLSEVAGAIQRNNGEVMFYDPEARLNKQFARIFGLDINTMNYSTPNTVTSVFHGVREWQPKSKGINGVMADSLAALSTDMEMENDAGDKMGMRRAKEFSEELRKTCRVLAEHNYLMLCSNQIRQNLDSGPYGQRYKSPGGEAIGFYSSLRLRTHNPTKIKRKVRVAGREVSRVVGVSIDVEVFKNSVWSPYRVAPITILFDYGIDDIRENLQYVKNYTKATVYTVQDTNVGQSMDQAVANVEQKNLEQALRNQVISLWEEIEQKFTIERKLKKR